MLDSIISVLGGGIVGGIARLVPEVLKFFDAKNARKHELDMQQWAFKFQVLQGDQKLQEIQAEGQQHYNEQALVTFQKAIEGQGKRSGVKWVDAVNSLIRPAIAIQWVLLLYPAVIASQLVVLTWSVWELGWSFDSAVTVANALKQVMGPQEQAIVSGVINFFLLNRVFDKVR